MGIVWLHLFKHSNKGRDFFMPVTITPRFDHVPMRSIFSVVFIQVCMVKEIDYTEVNICI